MRLAKLFAIVLCAAVLGFQTYIILSPLRYHFVYVNRYWPFLNYPMYSDAHKLGESQSSLAVRVVPCGPEATPVPVSSDQLRVKWIPFVEMLAQAANIQGKTRPAKAQSAAHQLRHFAATRLSFPVCTVQIWRRTYMIGPRGFEHADTAWRVAAQWPLTPEDSLAPDGPDARLP